LFKTCEDTDNSGLRNFSHFCGQMHPSGKMVNRIQKPITKLHSGFPHYLIAGPRRAKFQVLLGLYLTNYSHFCGQIHFGWECTALSTHRFIRQC